jgi:hypothetical protein
MLRRHEFLLWLSKSSYYLERKNYTVPRFFCQWSNTRKNSSCEATPV